MPVTALVTPGPEVTSAHADITRGARVGVGGMNRGLFVAHEDVLDLVLLVQLVVDIEYRAAGIAPNKLDFSSASARMSTVPPMDSASRGGVVSDVENSALGIFIHSPFEFSAKN
jgi:hypothetical protein